MRLHRTTVRACLAAGSLLAYALQACGAGGDCDALEALPRVESRDPLILAQESLAATPGLLRPDEEPPLVRALQDGKAAVVEQLLSRGVDVDQRGSSRITALMIAASSGDTALIERLLAAGASVHARNAHGFADRNASSINGVAVTSGYTALHFAMQYSPQPERVAALLVARGACVDAPDSFGNTPLIIALRRTDAAGLPGVRFLLAQGADTRRTDNNLKTPLHRMGVYKGEASLKQRLEIGDALLKAGADVAARDQAGRTPLHTATDSADVGVVRWLLSRGAEVDAHTKSGRTALFIAASMGSAEVLQALLEHGGDPNVVSDWVNRYERISALSVAIAEGHCHLVDPLLAAKADPSHIDGRRYSPLLHAMEHCPEGEAARLVQAGADPMRRGAQGDTALHIAARSWRAEFGTQAARWSQAAGASTARNDQGETAFHVAVAHGHYHLAASLAGGRTAAALRRDEPAALELARQRGDADLLRLFGIASPPRPRPGGTARAGYGDDGVAGPSVPAEAATAAPAGYWEQFEILRDGDRCQLAWPGQGTRESKAMNGLIGELMVRGFGRPGSACNPERFWRDMAEAERQGLLKRHAAAFRVVDPSGAWARSMLRGMAGDGDMQLLDEDAVKQLYEALFTAFFDLGFGADWIGVPQQFVALLGDMRARHALDRIGQNADDAFGLVEYYKAWPQYVLLQQRVLAARAASQPLRSELADVQRRMHVELRLLGEAVVRQQVARLASPGQPGADRESADVAAILSRVKALLRQRAGIAVELNGGRTVRCCPQPEAGDVDPQVLAGGKGSLYVSLVAPRAPSPLSPEGDQMLQVYLLSMDNGSDAKDDRVVATALRVTRRELDARVREFRKRVTTPDTPDEELQRAGRELFDLLFPGDLGRRVAAAQQLVVSPDGSLWDLPFAALVPPREGAPRYLGLDTPIVYAPSLFAHLVALASRRPKGPPGVIVALGDPDYSTTAAGAAGLARLPHSAREARQVLDAYGGAGAAQSKTLLTGAGASEQAFRTWAPRADVLHLAAHGVFDMRNPLLTQSGLWLASPGRQRGEADDGYLRSTEVFSELTLRADLVVLSSCEMARAASGDSAGAGDMVAAFLAAGARSVVASQWKVDDATVGVLTASLHRHYAAGMDKHRALQRAMQEVYGVQPRPYYWAGFTLHGTPFSGRATTDRTAAGGSTRFSSPPAASPAARPARPATSSAPRPSG